MPAARPTLQMLRRVAQAATETGCAMIVGRDGSVTVLPNPPQIALPSGGNPEVDAWDKAAGL
jgi:hypothetical protein